MIELFLYAVGFLILSCICMEIGTRTKHRDLENVMAISCICSLVATWIFTIQIFRLLMQ